MGEEVYDLGNDLYCAMLDKRLNYTCGYWKTATNLDRPLGAACRRHDRRVVPYRGIEIAAAFAEDFQDFLRLSPLARLTVSTGRPWPLALAQADPWAAARSRR